MKTFPIKLAAVAFLLPIVQIAVLFFSVNSLIKQSDAAYREQIPLIQNVASIVRLEEVQGKDIEYMLKGRSAYQLDEVRSIRSTVIDLIYQVARASGYKEIIADSQASLVELEEEEKRLFKEIEKKNWTLADQNYFGKYFVAKQKFTLELQEFVEVITFRQQSDYKAARNKQSFLLIGTVVSLLVILVVWGYLFITYRAAQQAQLRAENELELERSKTVQNAKLTSLGEMAAGIAHEINSPLAVIASIVSLLIKKKAMNSLDDLYFDNSLKKIGVTTQRIAKIISSLRSFSRDGSRDPFEKIKVSKLVEEVSFFCESKLKSEEVKFIVSIQNDFEFECRSIEIQQILLNLINNAADAIQKLDSKWILLSVSDSKNDCSISVTDSGQGIPPEILTKIMQPFYTTKEVGKGTGLGLSVSLGIAKSHGGSLEYDPSNRNTTFKLSIPKKQISMDTKTVA